MATRAVKFVRQPSREEIAARAYQLYLRRGRIPGHDAEDWLQAEFELSHQPVAATTQMGWAETLVTEHPLTQEARSKPC